MVKCKLENVSERPNEVIHAEPSKSKALLFVVFR